MLFENTIREMRELLNSWPGRKTDHERLFMLFSIKVLVETIEEPLKKRNDKKKAAYAAKTKIIKKALKQFLTTLDKIFTKHEEVGDSDVRDQMYAAIYRSFIRPQRGYSLPARFGMFSDKGNELVHSALQKFLTHPDVLAASRALRSPEDRFAAFQDCDVETTKGTIMSEYFGVSSGVRGLTRSLHSISG